MENIKLIQPTVELKSEFLEMVEEYLAAGDNNNDWRFEQALNDFEAYVQKFLDYAKGKNLPEGWVTDSTYWLVKDDKLILGRTSIRHRLTKMLRQRGGHIGYYIRPLQRRKGYGSLILTLSLKKVRKMGVKKVMITCDDDNAASARIIEKHGGVLEDKIKPNAHKNLTRRYWIDLK